jgi:hypothetical protein
LPARLPFCGNEFNTAWGLETRPHCFSVVGLSNSLGGREKALLEACGTVDLKAIPGAHGVGERFFGSICGEKRPDP